MEKKNLILGAALASLLAAGGMMKTVPAFAGDDEKAAGDKNACAGKDGCKGQTVAKEKNSCQGKDGCKAKAVKKGKAAAKGAAKSDDVDGDKE